MAVKVVVVDDSAFFRRRLKEILDEDPRISVVGSAENGAEAVNLVKEVNPDVITMDIEMPVMDGITAVKKIMEVKPTPILMLSALTTDGAKATLNALDAGAIDFLPKNIDDISYDKEVAKRLIRARIRLLGIKGLPKSNLDQLKLPARKEALRTPLRNIDCKIENFDLILIGTSTGGPAALQKILATLPKNYPTPILLIQHMPASFTPPFAQRLNNLCNISVKHAEDGDVLLAGVAYLAPGGKQMQVKSDKGRYYISINDGNEKETYKPSINVTFNSVANVCKGKTLGIILTGMGSDGKEGAMTLKQGGSTIWAQDEESCVVYGMPSAIVEAGIADAVLSLGDIETLLGNLS